MSLFDSGESQDSLNSVRHCSPQPMHFELITSNFHLKWFAAVFCLFVTRLRGLKASTDGVAKLYQDDEFSKNAMRLAENNFSFEHGIKGMGLTLEGIDMYRPNKVMTLVC